jgi:hypothetical protein
VLLAAVLAALACGGDGSARDAAPTRTPDAGEPAPAERTPEPTAAPEPARRAVAWTRAELLRRFAGRRLRVDGRAVRIDRATVTCGGMGAAAGRRGGRPAWTRFRCVQPTFPAGALAGPDAVFVVEPTGRRTFAVTERRLTEY